MGRGSWQDAEHSLSAPKATAASEKLTPGGASKLSAEKSVGLYELAASVEFWVRQGASSVTATNDAPSHYVAAGVPKLLFVGGDSDTYFAVYAASGDVYIQQL